MAARPASIKVRALQWLAQREHSRAELQAKLLRLLAASAASAAGAGPRLGADGRPDASAAAPADAQTGPSAEAEVEQLLDWLTAHGYLSSERFVESRVQARQGRFGNRRIQQELRQHGLGLAPDAQQALAATELDRAREVWRKKYGQAAADAAGRARQGRFLVGRGFSPEVVRRVVWGRGGDDSG